MLPRLQAQEQLTAIEAAALGSGMVKKDDRRRALAQLERRASGGRRRATKATPAMLRAIGVQVIEVPAKQTPEGDNV